MAQFVHSNHIISSTFLSVLSHRMMHQLEGREARPTLAVFAESLHERRRHVQVSVVELLPPEGVAVVPLPAKFL